MNFITQVTISIVLYFIVRVLVKKPNSLYIASFVSTISYIFMYLVLYQSITLLPTLHFLVTGLSLIILFISYYEISSFRKKCQKNQTWTF